MTPPAEDASPDPVDVWVGGQLRCRRTLLGLTQQALADQLALSFQQLQKYERGTNRISASKLYLAAKALVVPISYFFDGLPGLVDANNPDPTEFKARRVYQELLATGGGMEVAAAYVRIRSGVQRRAVQDLVEDMANAIPAANDD